MVQTPLLETEKKIVLTPIDDPSTPDITESNLKLLTNLENIDEEKTNDKDLEKTVTIN